jgi:hypothetical protein
LEFPWQKSHGCRACHIGTALFSKLSGRRMVCAFPRPRLSFPRAGIRHHYSTSAACRRRVTGKPTATVTAKFVTDPRAFPIGTSRYSFERELIGRSRTRRKCAHGTKISPEILITIIDIHTLSADCAAQADATAWTRCKRVRGRDAFVLGHSRRQRRRRAKRTRSTDAKALAENETQIFAGASAILACFRDRRQSGSALHRRHP